jgi:PAS domain S-box-containing protein
VSKIRVLIVEDEVIVAEDIAGKLRELGYDVCGSAVRGEEAVELVRKERPNLVLMDIRLKGAMDGVQAAEQVRREHDVPVIYLTAHSDRATLERAKLTDPFGYVLKPFDERELHTHIEMALYRHDADRKLRDSRRAALSVMEDSVAARARAEQTSEQLRREVAAREQAEEELRDAHGELHGVLASITEAYIAFDDEWRLVAANPAAEERVMGRPANEILGKVFWEEYPQAIAGEFYTQYRKAREDGKARHFEAESEITGRWHEAHVYPRPGRLEVYLRDITPRKRAEGTLRRNEAMARAEAAELQAVMDAVPAAILLAHDAKCEEVTGNIAASELFRLAPDANLSTSAPPEERPVHFRLMKDGREMPASRQPLQFAAATGRAVRNVEFDVAFNDGSIRHLWGHAVPVLDQDGSPFGAVAAFVDATERKRAEADLRRSREDLTRAQAVAHTGSWRLDVWHNVLEWSDEAYRIFGVPRGTSLTYDTFLATVHPDDRDRVDEAWNAALRGERYEIEHRIVVEGKVKWVRERAELELDAKGALRGGFGTVQDITERKEAEEALRRSEERFRTLFSTMSEGFALHEMIYDDEGRAADYRFLDVNPAFERLTGLKAAEIVGRTVREVLAATEPLWIERYGRVAQTGEADHFEHYSGGLGKWFEVYAYRTEPGRFAVVFMDITERRRAAEALSQTNRLLDGVVSSTHLLMACLDKDFNFIWVNRPYAQADGQEPSYFPGKNHFALYPSEENEAIFRRVAETGEPCHYDAKPFEYKEHPERGVTYWDWSLVPIKNAAGKVERLVFTLLDVTARIRAEQTRRQSEERYRTLFESSRDGIVFTDVKGRIREANPAYCEMVGYTIEELRQRDFRQLTPARWHAMEDEVIAHQVLTAGYSSEYEKEYLRRNGDTVPVNARLWLIKDDDGRPTGMWGIVRDIAARKQVEDALRDSQERLAQAIEAAHAGTWHLEVGSGEFVADDLTRTMHGLAHGAALDRRAALERVHPDDRERVATAARRAIREKTPYRMEYRVVRADGSERWVAGLARLVDGPHGPRLVGLAQDITERRHAEEEQRRLADILERTVDFVGIADAEQRFTYINASGRKMIGLSEGEDAATVHFSSLHPHWASQTVLSKGLPAALRDGTWTGETAVRTRSGREIPVSQVLIAHKTPTGTVECYSTIIRDTSERKRAEQALRESEARFRAVFEQAAVGMGRAAPDGRFLDVNQKLCEILGFSRKELMGKRFQDITHPDEPGVDLDNLASMLAGETTNYTVEKRYLHKDGSSVWVNVTVSLMRDPAGKPRHMVLVVEDISARKRTEDLLRESEEQYRAVFEHAALGVARLSPAGAYLEVNGKFCEITGYERSELLTRTVDDITHPDDVKADAESLRNMVAGTIETYSLEKRFVRKDGTQQWVRLTGSLVRRPSGQPKYIVKVIEDISARKKAQEETERALAELGQAAKELERSTAKSPKATQEAVRTLAGCVKRLRSH